ncbi:MAG: hypothetical protein B7Z53_05265, partial [Rhodospirillales bacterium 12-71-4]
MTGSMPHRAGQGGGIASDPRLLAGAAGGLLAALVALWAFRGLPLGGLALWFTPLPLFAAGIGFGPVAVLLALVASAALLLLSGSAIGLGLFLALFGLPAGLLVLAARDGALG